MFKLTGELHFPQGQGQPSGQLLTSSHQNEGHLEALVSLHEQSRGLGVVKLIGAECLLGMHEALVLCPAQHRPGMVVPACYRSTGKKAGEAGDRGQPWSDSKSEATLGYMRSHLKYKLIGKSLLAEIHSELPSQTNE